MEYAIIGGTGVYDPRLLEDVREERVETPYGAVSLQAGVHRGVEVAFMQRHGAGHAVPPHKINYRANIWGLKLLGVKHILATAAVGSLAEAMRPGHFVIIDQFLDFTNARQQTFFDGGEPGVVHTDMTEPYCPSLRSVLVETGRRQGLDLHTEGVYVCTEGPRFETAAEIRAFRALGGHVVGMTNVPEAVLDGHGDQHGRRHLGRPPHPRRSGRNHVAKRRPRQAFGAGGDRSPQPGRLSALPLQPGARAHERLIRKRREERLKSALTASGQRSKGGGA